MGFTRKEFMKALPNALHDYPYQINEDVITITPPESGSHQITITLGAEAIRKIALIQLPYIHVDFDFTAVDAATHQRFLTQFDLYYRKGGG
uniref:Uncharacterized protein n=1 Tax=uncultured Thiotrichaceae bacterium TaxID=298394 RepID=A0A6S6UIT4_9GAMM|nr:MAG: Unknown protein [uncultured Thiotrichaceae bacterium]